MNRQHGALIFRTFLCAASATATLFQIRPFSPSFSPVILSYFTIQSNILVSVYFLFLSIRSWKELIRHESQEPATLTPRFKGAVTMAIMLTGIVYMTLLAPGHLASDPRSFFNLSNLFVHGLTPLMVLLDWFLFSKKGLFLKKDIFLWTLIPIVYLTFIIIRAQFAEPFPGSSSRYPYAFIAIDTYGLSQVLLNLLVISIIYICIGWGYYALDRTLRKKESPTGNSP
ncbi:Pr6Pr family membrane protein [Parasphaerochaeta coccoides]|uniref:Pr6Pr family membrane protein n=1 Tax=Parasphaerochaeta coccoides (strain ATCC BAA-1237 / DSM 17374 / SPN1) TaxID=760011 RepID=F4GJ93_PARC1|nr:Pr6Pr family membrane protein [Parasphaerochaeta coccoides]AEC01733.1 hypothetical protein Spico_0505 [Parasphaerochaeta coccoides DSM 17374]